MKINLLPSPIVGVVAFVATLTMSACQDYTPEFTDISKVETQHFKESGQFDFSTTDYVQLSIDYNAPGYQSPVNVYTEYPYDEEGNLKDGIRPAYVFFLNDGKYEGVANLPTACTEVWLETSGLGLPMLTHAQVIGGIISFNDMTRAAINSTDVNDNFSEKTTTLVVDFSAQDWQTGIDNNITASTSLVVGSVTYNQVKSSYSSSAKTFPDGQKWNGSIKTGGTGEFNGKRCIKFSVSTPTTITVYAQSGGDGNRTVYISQYVNGTEKQLGTYTFTANSQLAMIEGNVSVGDVYVYANASVSYFAITRTSSPVLSADDYTYVLGSSNDNITANTSTADKNNLVALYPWSATGRPLVNVISKTTTDVGSPDPYHYYYYWDQNKNVQSNGITLSAEARIDDNYEEVETTYYSIYNMDAKYYWELTGSRMLYINTKKAGKIRIYILDNSGAAGKYLTITGAPTYAEYKDSKPDSEGRIVKIWETDVNEQTTRNNHAIAKQSTANILRVEFESAEEEERYACWFTSEGLHNDTELGTGGDAAANIFTWANGDASQLLGKIKVAYDSEYVHQGNLDFYYGAYMYHPNNNDPANWQTEENASFTFSLPKATTATLTVVFAHNYDGKTSAKGYYDFELNGNRTYPSNSTDRTPQNNVYQTVLSSSMNEATEFTITPDYNARRIVYVGVDSKDYRTLTELKQEVKKFARYDDANALPGYKLADVLSRLQTTLWSYDEDKTAITNPENASEIARSKANAKSWGGDAFNMNKAIKYGSAQDMNVVNNTKLYVTFLAEYNMRSANVLGYYFYKTGEKPANPNSLKKYIIFPNCTSAHYTLSKTYKVNDKYGNMEDAVPLTTGDQVQLMYYDEATSSFKEEFPAGTTVGWFVLYNGFDAWNAESQDLGTCQIRLDERNNDDYRNAGTIQPYPRFYYSNMEWNEEVTYTPTDPTPSSAPTRAVPTSPTSTKVRCIAVTDQLTKQISYCFEDSWKETTGADGLASSLKKDYTYDDLLFTVTATQNTDINDPSNPKLETTEDIPNITYTEDGMYLFEDIWEGDRTDFDMNDVVIDYKRTYTINSSNKIVNISEKYTLINDGGTYDDGFAVQLPYVVDDVLAITVSVNGSTPEKMSATTDITPNSDRSSRLERDNLKNKFNLVVFDHINLFNESEMGAVTYEFNITFKADKEPSVTVERNTTNVNTNNEAQEITYSYGRSAYNPFIIVYKYSADNGYDVADGTRCEIHLPGKETTRWGVVPGAISENNNRWYVAKITPALSELGINDNLNAMPFGLDLPIAETEYPGTGEHQLIHIAYPNFVKWVTSEGSLNRDWYSQSNRASAALPWQYIGK